MFNKDKERLSKCLKLLKEIDTDEMPLDQAYDIFSAINNVTFALSAITAQETINAHDLAVADMIIKACKQ